MTSRKRCMPISGLIATALRRRTCECEGRVEFSPEVLLRKASQGHCHIGSDRSSVRVGERQRSRVPSLVELRLGAIARN